MQIIKTDHLDNLDPLDHPDHHEHLNHLEHVDHLDNLDKLSHLNHPDHPFHPFHPDHPDHPDHLDLHDQPNQVSYNPDHQNIFQEDRYKVCITYFVLFQINLIGTEGALRLPTIYDNYPIHPSNPKHCQRQSGPWVEFSSRK